MPFGRTGSSLDIGEMWKYGYPKSPSLERRPQEKRSEDRYFICGVLRGQCDNLAIEFVGQNWSSESDLSFPGGLGGRASGIKLPFICGPPVRTNEGWG